MNKIPLALLFLFSSALSASDVTYTKDIRPRIFERVCSVCHNQNSPIPNWLDYSVAFAKAANIYERVVIKREMPPPTSGLILTEDEIALIEEWVDTGAPL